MMSAALAVLAASSPPLPAAVPPPAPTPVIVWVKAAGAKEVARIAFLGFDVDHPPRAPETLVGRLSRFGRTSSVMLRRRWQGTGAVPGGWVPADYVLDLPRGATGDAVLSLRSGRQGWFFHLGQT